MSVHFSGCVFPAIADQWDGCDCIRNEKFRSTLRISMNGDEPSGDGPISHENKELSVLL